MKITKLLPLAFALALVCPAHADVVQSTTANAPFQVQMPEYVYISRTSDDATLTTTVATIAENYRSFTLTGAMSATFHVATNKPGAQVKLSAKAADGTNQALYAEANGSSPRIVFTNSTPSAAVAQAAIDSAGANETGANNPNAIRFDITPTVGNDGVAAHGGAITATAFANNAITYTLKNGEYNFTYTLPTTINNNTFTTLDELGLYKATLYMDYVES